MRADSDEYRTYLRQRPFNVIIGNAEIQRLSTLIKRHFTSISP